MINLYNSDCMEALKGMKDNQYDLAIVDPPYGIGDWSVLSNAGSYKKPWGKESITNYKKGITWNDNIPTINYFEEVKRVSIRQIIWGANYYNSFSDLGGSLIWHKSNGHLVSQASQCEIASLSWKKQVDYVFMIKPNGFIKHPEYIHPCEKPVQLYKYLLKNYAKEGDKILDTHGGSMSIALACHDMKFDLDLYEIDKDYFDAGKKRYNNHIRQLQLF